MEKSTARPAMRRYQRRFLQAALAYAVLLLVTLYIRVHWTPDWLARVVLALAPGLAVVAMFAALGRYLLEETDEYLRNRMARQMLWATGATLSLATIWGFLDLYDAAPRLPLYVVAILWFFCLGIAGWAIRAREA